MAKRGKWLPLREAVAALADYGAYFHCNPALGLLLYESSGGEEEDGEMVEVRTKFAQNGELLCYLPPEIVSLS